MASINEISHEEVVSVRAFSSDLEELHEILELTMNVTADLIQIKLRLEFKYSQNALLCLYG